MNNYSILKPNLLSSNTIKTFFYEKQKSLFELSGFVIQTHTNKLECKCYFVWKCESLIKGQRKEQIGDK